MRGRLYATALDLFAEKGYDATTLREVADRAGVSVGLLYRYYPSKRSVVLALYETLSARYAEAATAMPAGKWRVRFLFALETSLRVLAPHRQALQALVPMLVADSDEGLFAENTAFSRRRVQQVFQQAVDEATDRPSQRVADSLGVLLYLVHLGVILWWLLDKSPHQRATKGLVSLLQQMLPSLSLTLRLPTVRGFVRSADDLFRDALIG